MMDDGFENMILNLFIITSIYSAIFGYLIGSIPFGLVLTRMAGLGDIRQIGSGNIGATNVLRTGNKSLAFFTLILDSGKGAVCVFILLYLDGSLTAIIAGLGAVIGHNFPIWLKFKGGKGVATTLGTLIALNLMVGIGACLTWVVVAAIFRISSLAALLALIMAPVYAWYLGNIELSIAVLMLAILSIIRHNQNIKRIFYGTEAKIGQK